MRFKRIISGAAALIMCISVAGCSNSDNQSSSSDGSPSSQDYSQVKVNNPEVESIGDLDYSDYIIETNADPDFEVVTEAEDAVLSGNANVFDVKAYGEFSGSGFVGGLTDENSKIEFEIEIPGDGSYDIKVVSASDFSGITGKVLVDGSVASTFSTETEFSENIAEKVSLTAGKHTIGIIKDSGAIIVDKITISASEPIDMSIYDVSYELSNPNANDTTQRLYNFLVDIYGKYILTGNYADETTGGGIDSIEFKEIYKNLNDYPAIMGLDFMNLSPSGIAHGTSSDAVLKAIEWDEKGGIVTFCWHWFAPEKYLEANDKPWWRGYSADAVSLDLEAIMNGEDEEGYELLLSDIDAIAEYLKELQSYDIPILWRPLHEAGGDPKWNNPWFWWGSGGSDSYIKLWQLMYDRLTNYHNLNNLIWVWNGQNVNWYPGDEYVDIIGYDYYAEEHDYSSQKSTFDYIKSSTDTTKMITLSENGVIPDPDACFSDGTRWSWFCTWTGEFTVKDYQLSGQYTELDMWKKVYTHERVLTLSELPDWKAYPLDPEKFREENGLN